jgi:hypothetical protein
MLKSNGNNASPCFTLIGNISDKSVGFEVFTAVTILRGILRIRQVFTIADCNIIFIEAQFNEPDYFHGYSKLYKNILQYFLQTESHAFLKSVNR